MRLTGLIGKELPRTKGSFLYIAAFVTQISIVAAVSAGPVIVPGTADPYLAGMPNGSTASIDDVVPNESPVFVPGVLPAGGSPITFTSVTGSVDNSGGTPSDPPDGSPGSFLQHLDQVPGSAINAENGIADLIAPIDSLLGVFLGPAQPSLSPAPIGLDFSLGQGGRGVYDRRHAGLHLACTTDCETVFHWRWSGQWNDDPVVIVPAGATRLYLGTMDGYGWNNNTGSFSVTVTETPAPTWIHAVPGQWSDASKWSSGVPNADGADRLHQCLD